MCEMTEAGKGEKMDMETQLETIHLYDQDAYQTEFSAKVLSCEVNRKNETLYDVVLDQTVFFPEEGGQSPDKGELNGIQVVDVQICDGIIIICNSILESIFFLGLCIENMDTIMWDFI